MWARIANPRYRVFLLSVAFEFLISVHFYNILVHHLWAEKKCPILSKA